MQHSVLVVDDEKDIRELLLKALSRLGGFRVEMAQDGEEALKKIEQEKFDLVLTDLKMPKMDGLQLISEIVRSRPQTLMVLMTGHGTIDSALEAMKRGASDYLTKPLNLDELVIRVQKVVQERQRFVSLTDYVSRLEKAHQELRRVDEVKSEFVSIASHELRTPLTTIKNAVQLILGGKTGAINEDQTFFLSMAEKNIDRLTNILNDLLDLSRIESGKIEMKSDELDLRGLIEFVQTSLKTLAAQHSISLKTEVAKEIPPVLGDREKVEQILTNLIGNAIKFTPEGGEVSVFARPFHEDGKMVAVSVTDSGIGIPEDQLEKVFKKFHQVNGSLHRSVGGTGLGLAITKGLVEAGEGTIWAESAVGKGSTFTFTLPVSIGEKRDPHFRLVLDRAFQRAQDNNTPLTLFLIEVQDDQAGLKNALLDQIEEKLKKTLCRKSDIVLRRERDEILAVICEVDLRGAQVIRELLGKKIWTHFIEGRKDPPVIKLGSATYPEEALSKRELFGKAKEHLRG